MCKSLALSASAAWERNTLSSLAPCCRTQCTARRLVRVRVAGAASQRCDDGIDTKDNLSPNWDHHPAGKETHTEEVEKGAADWHRVEESM
jgi:hypothetical protein